MEGPPRRLVTPTSAKSCLPPKFFQNHVAIDRTHSNLVKFAHIDSEYAKVMHVLVHIHRASSCLGSDHGGYIMDENDKRCLEHLRVTNPADDKDRIEKTKGGLLYDSYVWILDTPNFQMWKNDPDGRLLWIKGDPGKGKTMLLCGIINELNLFKTSVGIIRAEEVRYCHISFVRQQTHGLIPPLLFYAASSTCWRFSSRV
jgi:hypothetical protein